MKNRFYLCGAAIILCLSSGLQAQSSGGQFAIEKSVIAGGGQNASGGQFTINATNGQTVAGQSATGASLSIHAGFWNTDAFAPTASEVTVAGRITTGEGRGIRNVRILMTNSNGESRTALSGSFGYFRFTGVPAGETYVFTAFAKRYEFEEPSQVRTIIEETEGVHFVALSDF
jgi:hypothetical protein